MMTLGKKKRELIKKPQILFEAFLANDDFKMVKKLVFMTECDASFG